MAVEAIEPRAHFSDFEDYWRPFLSAQGPAPSYVSTLSETAREKLRAALESSLPASADGSIELPIRVWAARGTNPAAA